MNTRAVLAEFVGTFALIFVGVAAIAADFMTNGSVGLVGIALAHGLTIACFAAATMAISGGHLNPAVTFAMLLAKRISLTNALGYWAGQLAGAICAAALVRLAMPESALAAVNMGTPAIGAGVEVSQALIMEIVITFFLVFVIFGTAVDARAQKMGGLFIGLAVTLNIFAAGSISGAAMNPARHLGPALLGGGLENLWLYWVGPLAGGALGVLVYKPLLARSAS